MGDRARQVKAIFARAAETHPERARASMLDVRTAHGQRRHRIAMVTRVGAVFRRASGMKMSAPLATPR
jgi:hypothetical protein